MTGQVNSKEETDAQDGSTSYRQERRERRAQRRADRQAGGWGWLVGLVFITIGVLYMLYVNGILPSLANWWALFLLLPAVGTLSAAFGAYRHSGDFWSLEVIIPFLFGMFFLGLTAVFLFGLNFGLLWPLFLIAAGLLLLVGTLFGHASR